MKITRERLIQIIKEELTDQDLAVPDYQPPEEPQPEPESEIDDESYELRYDIKAQRAYLSGPGYQTVDPVGPEGFHDVPRHLVSMGQGNAVIQVKALDLQKMFEDTIRYHVRNERKTFSR